MAMAKVKMNADSIGAPATSPLGEIERALVPVAGTAKAKASSFIGETSI